MEDLIDDATFRLEIYDILDLLEANNLYDSFYELQEESGIYLDEEDEEDDTLVDESDANPQVGSLPLPISTVDPNACAPEHNMMPPKKRGDNPNLTSVPHQPVSDQSAPEHNLMPPKKRGDNPNLTSVPHQPVSDQSAPEHNLMPPKKRGDNPNLTSVPHQPVSEQSTLNTSSVSNQPHSAQPFDQNNLEATPNPASVSNQPAASAHRFDAVTYDRIVKTLYFLEKHRLDNSLLHLEEETNISLRSKGEQLSAKSDAEHRVDILPLPTPRVGPNAYAPEHHLIPHGGELPNRSVGQNDFENWVKSELNLAVSLQPHDQNNPENWVKSTALNLAVSLQPHDQNNPENWVTSTALNLAVSLQPHDQNNPVSAQPFHQNARSVVNARPLKRQRSVGTWEEENIQEPSTGIAFSSANTTCNEVVGGCVPINNYKLGLADSGSRTTFRVWKLREIKEPSQLVSLVASADQISQSPSRIIRLTYTKPGTSILALTCNALQEILLTRSFRNDHCLLGTATTIQSSKRFSPSPSGDVNDANVDVILPSFALSHDGNNLFETSRVENCLLKIAGFKIEKRFLLQPAAATAIALYPLNNNIIAVGRNDSSIQIYNVQTDKLILELKGHTKSVTGLAFSAHRKVLVSSGSDFQLCVWSLDKWEMLASKTLAIPAGDYYTLFHTHVHFDQDQTYFLAVNETQLGIYEAPYLACPRKWFVGQFSSSITDAKYSCDSLWVYASFVDGSVRIFAACTLQELCVIRPSAYLPLIPREANPKDPHKFTVAIATHPTKPHEFALGLTDGSIVVLNPPTSLTPAPNEGVVINPPQLDTPAPHDDGGRPGFSSKGSTDEQKTVG